MRAVTFGEIMLRLAPQGYERFIQSDCFSASFGGGEANVAVSLAGFGVQSAFITKLPNHELGQAAVNELRKYNVDTQYIVRGGDRLGIYFLEKGASQRPSKVIYDRAHSAIAEAEQNEFDWQKALGGSDWFHFTGITPALSESAFKSCLNVCKSAQKSGITVSCDLNYRKNLWSKAEANKKMSELMQYVNVCIANEEDAKDVFGIEAENSDLIGGKLNRQGYSEVAKKLKIKFGFNKVAISLRGSRSASDNDWSGMLYDGNESYFAKTYPIHIIDRVGGGDSFCAGLIYSLLSCFDLQKSIEFAVAASCLKHSIEGDFNLVTAQEVERLAGGDSSGRVQR